MSRASGVLAAMKAVPGGARYTPAPQSGGRGSIPPVAANALWGNASYASSYGPFLPRPSRIFTDGAFSPGSPIQPIPLDEPAVPGGFPDPRYWQPPISWNLPTQPRTEGLSLASFQTLYTLASKYSVARQCIQLRKDEILGLEWSIEMTTHAAKAYQGDHKAVRDFGERAAKATRFFKHPDPDYWNFGSFMAALLEEIFTYDALTLIFRPKYGRGLGRGLLGSDLDSLRLVSGPTIRPVFGMHGERPRPPAVAFQQYLFGVPRSDYQTILSGADVDDYGLTGSQVNEFRADVMLYAPLVPRRECPYGFPPVERALLPIISGLQKQEYQLSYFTEGTVPSVYISPGDPNMTPTQIRELQDALNGIAGDAAYHLKVICLPPGSKVEPQRPVDLSDTFDTLVQTQVCMAFDVMPDELGLLPNVGSAGAGGSSNASALRFASGESRDPKSRKSTKPLLMFLCDIANYVLQEICGQQDMEFRFEGLVAEDDKQALVERGIQGIQNGLYSIDEVRGWLDLPPWGLPETSEPVVFTAQGPIPFSMAPEIIRAAVTGNTPPPSQGTNSGQKTPSSRSRTTQPAVRRGGQTRPNGCLAAETMVVTADGTRPICDLLGRQRLLTDAGWVDAEIRAFGVQKLREVILRRGIREHPVFATPNHRWYLSDGSIKTTDELSAGVEIPFVSMIEFPYGEGSYPGPFVRAGATVREDAPGMHAVSSLASAGGFLLAGRQAASADDLQEVHGRSCCGMVAGTPQGSRRAGITPGCDTSAQVRDHVRRVQVDAGSAGRQVPSVQERGIGPVPRDAMASVGGSLSSMRAHSRAAVQQLQPQSRVAGKNGPGAHSRVPQWVVAAVLPTARVERVYCAVVPGLHRFVLAGGILTGNSHPKPVGPHRESLTPAHSAAAGAIQSPTPRTGGTPSRSPVAGSRKRGEAATGRATHHKAVTSELDALRRHLRKGRMISTWEAEHLPERALSSIAEDIAKGVLIDTAVERAGSIVFADAGKDLTGDEGPAESGRHGEPVQKAAPDQPSESRWPGWERDLGLVGAYKVLIGQAFHDAETRGSALRKKAATGGMFVSNATLRDLISGEVREVFGKVLEPLWAEAWHLGYEAAKSLVTGEPADFAARHDSDALEGFIAAEGAHWVQQISRTGLGNNSARSELIARSEVGRAIASAAIQCYRDHGVQFKHLLLSPGACEMCKDAAEDGDIPLDAPFSAGGVIGAVHPGDRCVPGPSWVDAEPPLADLGKASGYSLNSRSGMISLDLPPGAISPVPGGVDDHHITVVYLGPDVDDDAFAVACQRAALAAASVPGPLAGALSGAGTFPPSDSSDGKVPAWAGVMLPGAESLREALEDLSASEHKDWKPHVTLAYVEPGEPLPDPVPATPVTFTHLSVHRGHGEVVRFPLGPAGKSAPAEDESRVAWLLIRARDEDGKWRYLLQQRDDGQWGMPGGTCHTGEDGLDAAYRETREEIGDLPALKPVADLRHTDPDGVQAYLWLCEAGALFTPAMNGSTPDETAGTGWFRRRDVGSLRLAPKFADDWSHVIADALDRLKAGAAKSAAPLQRMVNENGEVLELTPASQRLQAVGSRWPYPHRADGAEWPDAGPGAVPDEHGSAGGEPPHRADDHAEHGPHADIAPRGSDDGKMPGRGRKPNPPAEAFPDQGSEHDNMWPMPQATLTPGVLSVGAGTGVPPSGASKNDSGHPVVGSVPAVAPEPYRPHAVQPEAFDPAETVEDWDPEGDTDVVHTLPKGAQHVTDANPVEWRHVYAQLEGNFPDSALEFVKHSTWVGPVNVPWSRIDDDDIDSWAASHQPEAVNRFAREIARGGAHTNPSILFHQANHPDGREVIGDGHHRAMARHFKLRKPVLAYVGTVPARWMKQALEMHSAQIHGGTSPQNT